MNEVFLGELFSLYSILPYLSRCSKGRKRAFFLFTLCVNFSLLLKIEKNLRICCEQRFTFQLCLSRTLEKVHEMKWSWCAGWVMRLWTRQGKVNFTFFHHHIYALHRLIQYFLSTCLVPQLPLSYIRKVHRRRQVKQRLLLAKEICWHCDFLGKRDD